MTDITDKLRQYSSFLDDVLKKEEDKVTKKTKCACGCGSDATCTCMRDSYGNASTRFYELFPEFKKKYDK